MAGTYSGKGTSSYVVYLLVLNGSPQLLENCTHSATATIVLVNRMLQNVLLDSCYLTGLNRNNSAHYIINFLDVHYVSTSPGNAPPGQRPSNRLNESSEEGTQWLDSVLGLVSLFGLSLPSSHSVRGTTVTESPTRSVAVSEMMPAVVEWSESDKLNEGYQQSGQHYMRGRDYLWIRGIEGHPPGQRLVPHRQRGRFQS